MVVIEVSYGSQSVATFRETHGQDLPYMPALHQIIKDELFCFLPGFDIPYSERSIASSGNHIFPVRSKRRAANIITMAPEDVNNFGTICFPKINHLFIPCCRGEKLAIGGQGKAAYFILMSIRMQELFSRFDVPQAYCAIARANQSLSIGAKGKRADHLFPDLPNFLKIINVPEGKAALPSGG